MTPGSEKHDVPARPSPKHERFVRVSTYDGSYTTGLGLHYGDAPTAAARVDLDPDQAAELAHVLGEAAEAAARLRDDLAAAE